MFTVPVRHLIYDCHIYGLEKYQPKSNLDPGVYTIPNGNPHIVIGLACRQL
jgi:hypothetical protein